MERGHARAWGLRSQEASGGFVLTEVLVAIGIFLILSGAVTTVYLMSLRTWQQGSTQVALQRKLSTAMQRIVQGERGHDESRQHGLREARDITITNPHTVEFISGVDDTRRRFHLNGNEVIYQPDATSSDGEERIYDPSRSEAGSVTTNYRSDARFSQMPDGTVEVRLIGEKRLGGEWVNAVLVTRIAPRNQEFRQ